MNRLFRPALEVNVVDHCNLRCANCDHFSPVAAPNFLDATELHNDLVALAKVLVIRELQLVGGEPLLHPGLLELVEVARSSGLARQITLITNGVLLHRADPRLFELLDGLWISRYPGVVQRYDETHLRSLAQEYGIWIWIKDTPTFGRKHLNRPNDDDALVQHIYFSCLDAHIYSCHTVHQGRYYKCPPSVYMRQRLGRKGIKFENSSADSVPLHDNPNLRADIARFIASDVPLQACRWCLGSLGPEEAHRQLDRDSLTAELEEAHVDPRKLVRPEFILPLTPSK
jgi:MoaA/NifB/PqqE/SkfB family radical SAM enzyme